MPNPAIMWKMSSCLFGPDPPVVPMDGIQGSLANNGSSPPEIPYSNPGTRQLHTVTSNKLLSIF